MNTTDHRGRPIVAVTGLGVVSSLGRGKEENWKKLTAGHSGIHDIQRFPTEGLRTTVAGTVDFMDIETMSAPELSLALAQYAANEAVAQADIKQGDFPGPLFLAAPPVEMEWQHRFELDSELPPGEAEGYRRLLQTARKPSPPLAAALPPCGGHSFCGECRCGRRSRFNGCSRC